MNNQLKAYKQSDILIRGKVKVEHYDRYGKLLNTFYAKNNVTTEGKNKLFDIMFHGVSAIDPWYIGVVDATGWTAETALDTLASHSGWLEFTGYTGNRKEWTEGAASGQSITNGTSVDFAITSGGSLKGILIASAATGTSGTLWATVDFASTVIVSNGDTIKITYTVNA